MESTVLFAGLVGAVGVLHLLSRAVEYVQRASGIAHSQAKVAKKNKRSDWYVFFCWSDLVGRDAKDTLNRKQDGDRAGIRENTAVHKPASRPRAQQSLRLSV